jgi:hypothetical protein
MTQSRSISTMGLAKIETSSSKVRRLGEPSQIRFPHASPREIGAGRRDTIKNELSRANRCILTKNATSLALLKIRRDNYPR